MPSSEVRAFSQSKLINTHYIADQFSLPTIVALRYRLPSHIRWPSVFLSLTVIWKILSRSSFSLTVAVAIIPNDTISGSIFIVFKCLLSLVEDKVE